MQGIPVQSRPIELAPSTESKVYLLFALAMGLTVIGVIVGQHVAGALLSSGVHFFLFLVEIGLIFSARVWMDRSPINYFLFGLFPLLSGLTITPYLLVILAAYANGASILLNALLSTVFLSLAAGVLAKSGVELSGLGRPLLFGVIGLLVFGLLQLFVPSLRGGTAELLLSGAGVVIFALFTAFDLQRVAVMSGRGMNPFLLALSLYLDIFNLFLFILRFMTAMSGNRR